MEKDSKLLNYLVWRQAGFTLSNLYIKFTKYDFQNKRGKIKRPDYLLPTKLIYMETKSSLQVLFLFF